MWNETSHSSPASSRPLNEDTPSSLLIVEDERLVALDLQILLEQMGHKVVASVASGEEAIRLAHELRPDLVIMDIQLRGALDGISAAREIRSRDGIPVLFLTSFADDDTARRVSESDPRGYLLKPFRRTELRLNIEIALANARNAINSPVPPPTKDILLSSSIAEHTVNPRLLIDEVMSAALEQAPPSMELLSFVPPSIPLLLRMNGFLARTAVHTLVAHASTGAQDQELFVSAGLSTDGDRTSSLEISIELPAPQSFSISRLEDALDSSFKDEGGRVSRRAGLNGVVWASVLLPIHSVVRHATPHRSAHFSGRRRALLIALRPRTEALLRWQCLQLGVIPVGTPSLEAALYALREKERFDVALLDADRPGSDLGEALRLVRTARPGESLSPLALSRYNAVRRVIELEPAFILSKPVSDHRLEEGFRVAIGSP